MATKDRDGEDTRGTFYGLEFIGRYRKVRGDRKRALKVQLSHAMNQIIVDVEQAIELNMREVAATRSTSE